MYCDCTREHGQSSPSVSDLSLTIRISSKVNGSVKSNCRKISDSIGGRQIRESVLLLVRLRELADLSTRGNRRTSAARTAGNSISKEAQVAVRHGRKKKDEKGRRK